MMELIERIGDWIMSPRLKLTHTKDGAYGRIGIWFVDIKRHRYGILDDPRSHTEWKATVSYGKLPPFRYEFSSCRTVDDPDRLVFRVNSAYTMCDKVRSQHELEQYKILLGRAIWKRTQQDSDLPIDDADGIWR